MRHESRNPHMERQSVTRPRHRRAARCRRHGGCGWPGPGGSGAPELRASPSGPPVSPAWILTCSSAAPFPHSCSSCSRLPPCLFDRGWPAMWRRSCRRSQRVRSTDRATGCPDAGEDVEEGHREETAEGQAAPEGGTDEDRSNSAGWEASRANWIRDSDVRAGSSSSTRRLASTRPWTTRQESTHRPGPE